MPASETVIITAKNLPVVCPSADESLWNQHPRVFLPLDDHGECRCPYCGTHYRVQDKSNGQHA